MKLAVFGATGPSGQIVLRKALAGGHEVTAYVRNPAKLVQTAPNLTVITGELSDKNAIRAAVAGKDAVISLLGPSGRTTGTPITEGMHNIVAAMETEGVRRLIATATPSARDQNDRPSLPFWLAVKMVKALAGTAYQDIVGAADAVRSSALDWTLVRLALLTNRKAAKPAAAGYIGDKRIRLFSLSRTALADFLLDQLADATWSRRAPALSNGR